MPIIETIGLAGAVLKGAIDAAKSANLLELRGQLYDVQEKLFDLRDEAFRLQHENLELQKELAALKAKKHDQEHFFEAWQVYWKYRSNNPPDGPFCARCLDVTEKAVRLRVDKFEHDPKMMSGYCLECKSDYAYPDRPVSVPAEVQARFQDTNLDR